MLASVSELFNKLEREAYRAFHAKTRRHKADHFLNFCITAHAMRDHILEALAVPLGPARTPYHEAWNRDPLLLAVREIANQSKHFELRDKRTGKPKTPKTKRVVRGRGSVMDVHMSPSGNLSFIPRRVPEIRVTTSDGARHDLWRFCIDVIDTWYLDIRGRGLQVRRSSLRGRLDE